MLDTQELFDKMFHIFLINSECFISLCTYKLKLNSKKQNDSHVLPLPFFFKHTVEPLHNGPIRESHM